MGQEFIIKSQALEDKVNQLLPSQGGFQAGVDLSASTTVIPIVDLTETAEGSDVRVDLQTALSFKTATAFAVNNATSTIITTTGYYRLVGTMCNRQDAATQNGTITINDGATDKTVFKLRVSSNAVGQSIVFDLIIFLEAGHSCKLTASNAMTIDGSSRQIADINGNLTNP